MSQLIDYNKPYEEQDEHMIVKITHEVIVSDNIANFCIDSTKIPSVPVS